MQQKDDADAVRSARKAISAAVDDDVDELIRYYIDLQRNHQDRLLPSPGTEQPETESLLARDR